MANNKETKTVKENKNKKSFFKSFKAELKKVVWPTPKQLVNNTIAVVTIVLITAIIVFVLDLAFESINTYGIDKIREVVTSSNTTNESNQVEEEASEENGEEGTQNNEATPEENAEAENNETNNNETNTENNAQ